MSTDSPEAEALDGEIIPPDGSPIYALSTTDERVLAEPIVAAHAELVEGMRTTVEKAVIVGRMLLEAKPRFRGSRRWLWWLETYTPIKRRMAAHYVALATARAEMDGRKWKRISNLGIAGAVAELRRRKQASADRSSHEIQLPASRPRHRAIAEMVDLFGRVIAAHLGKYPDLHPNDVLDALDEAADRVRQRAKSARGGSR